MPDQTIRTCADIGLSTSCTDGIVMARVWLTGISNCHLRTRKDTSVKRAHQQLPLVTLFSKDNNLVSAANSTIMRLPRSEKYSIAKTVVLNYAFFKNSL